MALDLASIAPSMSCIRHYSSEESHNQTKKEFTPFNFLKQKG